MIRSVSLRGFMNINDGRHAFAPGLNVIVAPNGAGGHNLLKLLCAVESAGAFTTRWMTKLGYAQSITGRLRENFRPGCVGDLARGECAVELEHEEAQGTLAFGFKSGSEFVSVDAMPSGTAPGRPVFIPMQELASFVPWFPKLFEMWHVGCSAPRTRSPNPQPRLRRSLTDSKRGSAAASPSISTTRVWSSSVKAPWCRCPSWILASAGS